MAASKSASKSARSAVSGVEADGGADDGGDGAGLPLLPLNWINLKTGVLSPQLRHRQKRKLGPRALVLSEFGTFQLEFGALSEATGDPRFARAAAKAVTAVARVRNCRGCPPGLYPYLYLPANAAPANRYITIR